MIARFGTRIRARVAASALALMCLPLAGCGESKQGPTLYPVSGKVVGSDGKPLEHVSVVLHPVGSSDPEFVKPRAQTKADGTFAVTTLSAGDGSPAGEYRVTLEQWLVLKPDAPPANKLPAKYAKPETSGLKATVNAGPTDLAPFTIQR